MNKQTLERACKNYNPDKDYNGGWGHYLAEQSLKQKADEELEQRAEFENDFAFVNEINKLKINIKNKYADRQIKEKLMKKYFNYPTLKGFKSWANCPDYAVGSASENKYNSALKKVKEYTKGGGK